MIVEFSKPLVIAHRGASGYAPENTLAAMQKARDLQIGWVEFDVMLTACGTLVVHHDETVDRTSNAWGRVEDLTLAQLLTLDFGEGENILSCETLLRFLAEQDLQAVIELKPHPGQEQLTAEKLVALIHRVWPQAWQRCIFSSFAWQSLVTLHELQPQWAIGVGLHEWHEEWQQQIHTVNAVSLHVNHRILSADRVEKIKQKNVNLLAYTVNQVKIAQQLVTMGVDGLFSDYPDKIRANVQRNS